MECASNEKNGLINMPLQKRQRTEDSLRPAMVDFDVLDCPICFEPFTIPIFQCDNGHFVCSSCCTKLRNRCPSCDCPIGKSRCRAMEIVVESVFVPCQNAKLGCTENVSFVKESTHKEKCNFSPYSCPVQDCNFTGLYKDLYDHYTLSAHPESMGIDFECGTPFYVLMNISDKISIKREVCMRLMFAVQCFREPYGVYVTVSCIAPSSPEVGEFSYEIFYITEDGRTITYESLDVMKTVEVKYRNPSREFHVDPSQFLV